MEIFDDFIKLLRKILMNFLSKFLIFIAGLFVLSLICAFIFWVSCVDFIENYESAYLFNTKTGEVIPLIKENGQPQIGYIVTWPIINKVYKIDTRPVQICISANSRVLNCKLISFNPKGYKQFFSWHGIANYPLSSSTGGGVSSSGMNTFESILMSYAFDPGNLDYSFLNIIKDNNVVAKNDSIK